MELHRVAAMRLRAQRRAVLPALGQREVGVEIDVAAEIAGGIKQRRIPLHIEHRRRHDDAALGLRHRRHIVER